MNMQGFYLRCRGTRIAIWVTIALLVSAILAGPMPAQKRPSLDKLIQRVEAYWNLLLAGKKAQAQDFVEPGSRKLFLARKIVPFSEPRLVRLEPSRDGKEVLVTVEVRRSIPPLPVPIDHPVTEKWVFQGNNWFALIQQSSLPFSTASPSAKAETPDPEEMEKRKQTIMDRLRFDHLEIDFGTVRKGHLAPATIHYELSGDEAMGLNFEKPPVDLIVRGLESWRLLPGGPHQIELELITSNLDGPVEQTHTMLVRYREVSVPFSLMLRANVYAPVSAVPPVLRFMKGEKEKEVVVKNNSQSAVQIGSIYSQTSAFSMQPLPISIPPGESVQVKINLLKDPGRSERDILSLMLQPAVEGMASLEIQVLVNPPDPQKKDPSVLTPEELQQLLRKAKPPIPPGIESQGRPR